MEGGRGRAGGRLRKSKNNRLSRSPLCPHFSPLPPHQDYPHLGKFSVTFSSHKLPSSEICSRWDLLRRTSSATFVSSFFFSAETIFASRKLSQHRVFQTRGALFPDRLPHDAILGKHLLGRFCLFSRESYSGMLFRLSRYPGGKFHFPPQRPVGAPPHDNCHGITLSGVAFFPPNLVFLSKCLSRSDP